MAASCQAAQAGSHEHNILEYKIAISFSTMPFMTEELDERGDSSSGRNFVDRNGTPLGPTRPDAIEYRASRLSLELE